MNFKIAVLLLCAAASSAMAQTCLNNCGAFQGECMSCHVTQGGWNGTWNDPYYGYENCFDCWYCQGVTAKPPAALSLLDKLVKTVLPKIHAPLPLPSNHDELMKRANLFNLGRAFQPDAAARIKISLARKVARSNVDTISIQ